MTATGDQEREGGRKRGDVVGEGGRLCCSYFCGEQTKRTVVVESRENSNDPYNTYLRKA